MSAFNEKQGKETLYQIQRCGYTKFHSTWSPGADLKPQGLGIKFLMELGSQGKGINFWKRRRRCLEIPPCMLQADAVPLFPFFPHCIFFQANKSSEHFSLAMLVVLHKELLELKCTYFTINKIVLCRFHEGISTANKPFAQNNHSSFTPGFNQTQVTTDAPNSGWGKPHFSFSLGPSLPAVLLILCWGDISGICTTHTETSSANATTGKKRQTEYCPLRI